MTPTPQEIIYKLRTEPLFLSDTIVYNNPMAVAQKLEQHTDYVSATEDALAEYVRGLIAEKQLDVVNDILQVPFNEQSATETLKAAHEIMIYERGATKQGRFLDTSGGLFILAMEPHEVDNPTLDHINPNLKKKCGCGCSCKGKKITITQKHLIIAAVVIGLIVFLALKKSK